MKEWLIKKIEKKFLIENLRIKFEDRKGGYSPVKGFGISTKGDCLGTTYGDPRHRFFRDITFLIGRHPLTLSIYWLQDNYDKDD